MSIGPLDRCGIWRVGRPNPAVNPEEEGTANAQAALLEAVQVACNLNDPRESDLKPSEKMQDLSELNLARAGGKPMWFYLTLLAVLLMGVEWVLYQRRHIS